VTYPAMPMTDRMFAILREEAKACGFELRLDGLEFTVAYKKEMQKQHEMAFGSWLISRRSRISTSSSTQPTPSTKRATSSPRPTTCSSGAGRTPTRSAKSPHRRTEEELRDAAWKLQRIMHDEAIFVPAYSVDFVRIGSWRWVRWPDSKPPVSARRWSMTRTSPSFLDR
jgi:microcin C transport system substrate-binding protein